MPARHTPYEQFGPFILLKKLESDSLGDLWRAVRIDAAKAGPAVALRRLSGGSRPALAASAESLRDVLPRLSGTSFVRGQRSGVVDSVPFLTWEYGGGRSLRYILERARGTSDTPANPLQLDQALAVAERVAQSLSTMADLRDTTGAKLSHGALLPHFIWITDDGEIRVAGQLFGSALITSLGDARVASEIGRYFSPDYRETRQQKTADVYSMGAILFLLVTGQEPPDATSASAFAAAVRAAKTPAGASVPDDIRVILDKSFNLDPSMRYASVADMRQALAALATSGKYSATTFNLAFYLSTLLKKEMEHEAQERSNEAALDAAAYAERPKAPQTVIAAPAPSPAEVHVAAPVLTPVAKPKSRLALAAGGVVGLAALAGAGYVMLQKTSGAATKPVASVAAQALPPVAAAPPVQRVISEPIIAAAEPAATPDAAPATATSADPQAQQKAFEEAVRQKLQAEMMKLQNDYMAELKQKQSKNAPVVAAEAAPPAPERAKAAVVADERPSMTAAELDQQRREAARQQEGAAAAARPVTPAPPVATQNAAAPPAAATVPPTPAPVQPPAIREGDVIDVANVDSVPRPTHAVRPVYPPLALRQKVAATIILTAFINERGEVTDVKVLRGEPRFGMNDAAIKAIRNARFSPAVKDGKRVKTWVPQTIQFVPK